MDVHSATIEKIQENIDARRSVDLKAPPANRLEALKGTRKGKYIIRVNDQHRIVSAFKDGDAHEGEITASVLHFSNNPLSPLGGEGEDKGG